MAESKPKEIFHFVTFRGPSAKPSSRTHVEKAQARSHAARITHSRRKATRGHTIVKWVVENQETRAGRAKVNKKTEVGKSRPPASPISVLPQTKVDPFMTYPHAELPAYLQSCLEYVYESIHPRLISVATANELGMVKIAWRRLGQQWPLMFHLQVSAAANLVRADINNGPLPNKIEILRLKHQSRGLALVMAELQNLDGLASDSLLMAMTMIAMLTDPNHTRYPEVFRISPLATAQSLHLYARLTIIPSMIQALMGLVTKRGGIQTIKEYGMTQVLQFADLMLSSRLGMQPSFPWLHPPLRILDSPVYSPDQEAVLMSLVIGTGFKQLDTIDMQLAGVLRAAGEVTVALDHYQQRRPNSPVLNDLTNAGNEVQYRLLSIVPSLSPEPDIQDFLRNMCRLAGLIYNDLVLYPLPPTTEVRPRLAGELSIALEKFEIFRSEEDAQYDDEADDYTNLVIWILMMGAFASNNTASAPYYVDKLRQYIVRVSYLTDWPSFSNLMATYLWWEYIFAEPAAALWMEMFPQHSDFESSSTLVSSSVGRSPLSLDWAANEPNANRQSIFANSPGGKMQVPGVSIA